MAYLGYPLRFQVPEYAHHRRIIITIASATNALAYAVPPKTLLKVAAAALGELNRSSQHRIAGQILNTHFELQQVFFSRVLIE